MGVLAEAFRPLALLRQPVSTSVSTWQTAAAGLPNSSFRTFAAEGYGKNETVYAAIELRATSAAEPRIIGRRRQKGGPPQDVHDHPLLTLLNRPNPVMSHAGFWSTLVMDRDLAGNAYALKARGERAGNVTELWRLRPDRVQVIPVAKNDPTQGVAGYQYREGIASVVLPANDVIHFKTRHPLDDWYGMPPLAALSGRVDLDNYLRDFTKAFFQNGGSPGAVLSTKSKLTQDAKDQIRQRFRNQFGGAAGWHDLLVIDANETTYTPMNLSRGLRDLMMGDLEAVAEAHISMVYGVPASILGALVGLESSSYANKRQDWAVFWDITMAPLFREFSDVLEMSLLPEFSGLDGLLFDLSDVRALQEDVDKLQDRWRKDLAAEVITEEEYRINVGLPPESERITGLTRKINAVGALVRAGYDPAEALAALGLPPITHLGPLPVTVQPEESEPVALPTPPPSAMAQIAAPERVIEARCPTCNALCGKQILRGEAIWCRKCKANFPAGGPTAPTVLRRMRFERDGSGNLIGLAQEEVG